MTSAIDIKLGFDNSFASLPDRFYARLAPTPVREPRLIAFNRALAADLGLDVAAIEPHAAALFSGNTLAADAAPLAQAYAGHQFGHFVPQLGDGRAHLLGEVIDRAGRRRDIQLKGSGQTPFSRRGDGRAALGPVLREYIVGEAMHAFGIPTTRALAAVLSGEAVFRDEILPGAILTRVAASHIRVGTFQYYAARRDVDGARLLADHVIARHYPDLAKADQPYLALLDAVAARQAALIAAWMSIGFIHGVMNTDNMAVSGETIDYGPCAFMDAFDPNKVFSSIDQNGRYAFSNQPTIAGWNLTRFAETLLPLIDADSKQAVAAATEVMKRFTPQFDQAWLTRMRPKLGLTTAEDGDAELIGELLDAMHASHADFTLTFRHLCEDASYALEGWMAKWRARLAREGATPATRAEAMRRVNPAYIPRNHRIEQAIAAAVAGDFGPFDMLMRVLAAPFDARAEFAAYAEPPQPKEIVTRTFCGT
ncbi:MAG: YdiU family protein [Alphaproteobacteria bacterium]|nr:YdiU family protein [Alphaproteobacteria bacterium]